MKNDVDSVLNDIINRAVDALEFWESWVDYSYTKGVYNRYANSYNKSSDKLSAFSMLMTLQRGLKERKKEVILDENEEVPELMQRIVNHNDALDLSDYKHSKPTEPNLTTRETAIKIVSKWVKECKDQIEYDGGLKKSYLEYPLEVSTRNIMLSGHVEALTTITDSIIFYDYPDKIKVFEELTKEEQEDIRSRPGRKMDHEAAPQDYIERVVNKLVEKGGRFTKKDGTPKPTTIRDELIKHSEITLGERQLFDRVKKALHKMQ